MPQPIPVSRFARPLGPAGSKEKDHLADRLAGSEPIEAFVQLAGIQLLPEQPVHCQRPAQVHLDEARDAPRGDARTQVGAFEGPARAFTLMKNPRQQARLRAKGACPVPHQPDLC